jgi:hypothetical protein
MCFLVVLFDGLTAVGGTRAAGRAAASGAGTAATLCSRFEGKVLAVIDLLAVLCGHM